MEQKLELVTDLCGMFALSIGQFNSLWAALKEKKETLRILAQFMIEGGKGDKTLNLPLRGIKEQVFQELLCGMNDAKIRRLDPSEYDIFEVFFVEVNIAAKFLARMAKKHKLMNPELRGL